MKTTKRPRKRTDNEQREGGGGGGIMAKIRSLLAAEVIREVPWVLWVQSYRHPILDMYFKLASLLGEEIFYITFLPMSAWVLAPQFAAHETVLLALSVGGGNMLKNILRAPRPPHPPVWINSKEQEKDYGIPSTHTMTSITIPWYLVIFYGILVPAPHEIWLSPLTLFLLSLWSISVMISRIYNGQHSPMDVIAGVIISFIILLVFTFILRPLVDLFFSPENNSAGALIALIVTGITALLLHPAVAANKPLTPAHAESGLVVGTMVGTFLVVWLKTKLGGSFSSSSLFLHHTMMSYFYSTQSSTPVVYTYPFTHHYLINNPLLHYTLRFLLGVLVVAVVRTISKKVFLIIITSLFGRKHAKQLDPKLSSDPSSSSSPPSWKYTHLDVAIKFLTYTCVSASVLACPFIFTIVGLHAPLDDLIVYDVVL